MNLSSIMRTGGVYQTDQIQRTVKNNVSQTSTKPADDGDGDVDSRTEKASRTIDRKADQVTSQSKLLSAPQAKTPPPTAAKNLNLPPRQVDYTTSNGYNQQGQASTNASSTGQTINYSA